MAIAKWRVGPNQAIKAIEEKSEGRSCNITFQKDMGSKFYSLQLVNFLEKKKREEFSEFRILGTLYSIPHGLQNSFVKDKSIRPDCPNC